MSFGMDKLIEERIRRAQAEGAFEQLPGTGQPLNLDDDLLIPEDLRMVCRVLKNAGYVPPEVEQLRELRLLEAMVLSQEAEGVRLAARKRLEYLLMQLEQSGMARVAEKAWAEYAEKVTARIARSAP